MEIVYEMLESYMNRSRNSNVDRVPVMDRWMENCKVRWVMGMYCQLGCVTGGGPSIRTVVTLNSM